MSTHDSKNTVHLLATAARRGLIVLAGVVLISNPLTASQNGIGGYSSSPHTTGGSSCLACHTQTIGQATSVSISGPSVVNANSTNTYTVTINGGPAVTAGINISVDKFDGELQAVNNELRLIGSDLSQSTPKRFSNGQVTFNFRWRAPSYNVSTTIFAAANSSNGRFDLVGDAIAASGMAVVVQNGSGSRPQEPDPGTSAIKLETVATGLGRAVAVTNAGDSRLFVVEQTGKINIVDASGNVRTQPFLDISSRVTFNGSEQGLLGLAFDPNYSSNGYFYVHYSRTANRGLQYRGRISRFKVSANSQLADVNSEKVLLEVDSRSEFHNGGDLQFGPDGYLYISVGDGVEIFKAADPLSLRGKVLRIDVSGAPGANNAPDCGLNASDGYRIPPGNAYRDGRGGAGCDEVYALGLRNPWRISLDRATGDLWIGDVGQGSQEEVNFLTAGVSGGANLGWPCREGDLAFNSTACTEQYISPVHTYGRSVGRSITGGFVYRGSSIANLRGRYLFTDYGVSNNIYALVKVSGGYVRQTVLSGTGKVNISSFGESASGEIYVISAGSGELFKIVSANPGSGNSQLSVQSASVTEGINNVARVRVNLSPASNSPVTVRLTTDSGTASPGNDYVGFNEILTFAPGETAKDADITILDDNIVEADESLTVRLSGANGAEIETATALVTIKNDDVATTPPTLSIEDRTVNESDGTVSVTVSLSRNAEAPVTVNVATQADSATTGSDFAGSFQTLDFRAGQSSQTVDIGIINDRTVESTERFFLRLTGPSGATIADGLGTVTIQDDDTAAPPDASFSVSPVSVSEGAGSVRLSVRLSQPLPTVASVGITNYLETAVAGQDYHGFYQRLTFEPGETVKTLDVVVLDDSAVEGDEAIGIRLFEEEGATIATATSLITIVDNDQGGAEPTLNVSSVMIGEADGQASLQISLSNTSSQVVTFGYSTVADTALPGRDFYGKAGTLSFQPGQRTRNISVDILNDNVAEAIERLSVRVFEIEGALPGKTTGTINIVDDDNAAATLSIVDKTVNEDAGTVGVEVRLSSPAANTVIVQYATAVASAMEGEDYWGIHSSIRFLPGETVKQAEVVILEDDASESTETFVIRIYQAQGANITNARGRISIIDND